MLRFLNDTGIYIWWYCGFIWISLNLFYLDSLSFLNFLVYIFCQIWASFSYHFLFWVIINTQYYISLGVQHSNLIFLNIMKWSPKYDKLPSTTIQSCCSITDYILYVYIAFWCFIYFTVGILYLLILFTNFIHTLTTSLFSIFMNLFLICSLALLFRFHI